MWWWGRYSETWHPYLCMLFSSKNQQENSLTLFFFSSAPFFCLSSNSCFLLCYSLIAWNILSLAHSHSLKSHPLKRIIKCPNSFLFIHPLKKLHIVEAPSHPFLPILFIHGKIPPSNLCEYAFLKWTMCLPFVACRDLLLMESGDLLWQPLIFKIFYCLFLMCVGMGVHICMAHLKISSRMQLVSCLVSDWILMQK